MIMQEFFSTFFTFFKLFSNPYFFLGFWLSACAALSRTQADLAAHRSQFSQLIRDLLQGTVYIIPMDIQNLLSLLPLAHDLIIEPML
jgi:hypothetical protein